MRGGAQWTKMGGQADFIHFFCCEYFKNYLKNEKFENIKNFNLFFCKFWKKKFEKFLEKKKKNLRIFFLKSVYVYEWN